MVELIDTYALGAYAVMYAGLNPATPTCEVSIVVSNWGFVYLIREKRSYLHNPECVGQVIRRKGNLTG